MTPEGRTKTRIKALLQKHGVWYYMPQQFGMGDTHLDFICSVKREIMRGGGYESLHEMFFIEAKKHGGDPTPRQWAIIERERARGMKVFVCDDEHKSLKPKHDSLSDIEKWLTS